jgi:hypothetical protein
MKILIVFRGENVRNKRGYVSSLECINNWKQAIYDDLMDQNNEVDTVLFTYKSDIVEELKLKLNVKEVFYTEFDQKKNMIEVCKYLIENKKYYDRVIIMRFDFQYKIRITKWKNWNEKGIHIVNRDVHWPSQKLYSDILFIVDKEYIDLFYIAVINSTIYLHQVGTYIFNEDNKNKTKILKLMYDEYYGMMNNPLHSLKTLEVDPDINNYDEKSIIEYTDLTEWN